MNGTQHLVSLVGDSISDTIAMESAGISPLSDTASSLAVADIPRIVASSMLLEQSCRGYISAPHILGGQVHICTPKASTKAWQSCPASTFTLCSSINTFSFEYVVGHRQWLHSTPQPLL